MAPLEPSWLVVLTDAGPRMSTFFFLTLISLQKRCRAYGRGPTVMAGLVRLQEKPEASDQEGTKSRGMGTQR